MVKNTLKNANSKKMLKERRWNVVQKNCVQRYPMVDRSDSIKIFFLRLKVGLVSNRSVYLFIEPDHQAFSDPTFKRKIFLLIASDRSTIG